MPVVEELARTRSVELIFVDDGSSDGSLSSLERIFQDQPVNNVALNFQRHEKNRGLGAAIRTGFAASKGEIVVTTDSDGTYRFTNIPALLSFLTQDVAIVTASPYHPDGGVDGVPGYRLILSMGSSMIYRILVDWHIHTYTCLFRAYRREVIESVSFESDGFLAGTELLVKGMLMGYRVAEFPAVLYSRAFGTSKAKLARTIIAHLRFQARVLFHRLHLLSIFTDSERNGGQQWAQSRLSSLGGKQK